MGSSGARKRRRREARTRRRHQLGIQNALFEDIERAQRGELGPSSQARVDRSTALTRAAGERARVRSVDQLNRGNVGGSFASKLLNEQTRDVEQGIAGIIPDELFRMAGLATGVAQQPVQEIGTGKGPEVAQYAGMGGQLAGTAAGAYFGGPAGASAGGAVGQAAGSQIGARATGRQAPGGGGKPGGGTSGGSVPNVGGGWGNFSTQNNSIAGSQISPNYGLGTHGF